MQLTNNVAMEHIRAKERKIAVFWDYESVPPPPDCSPAEAAEAISRALSQHGHRIEMRRAYYDPYKYNRPREPSGLGSSGFDLVQTPSRYMKETLDKKLIADVLTFAWDCTSEDRDPCVVLITSDGDYAYTLSKLRDRGIMTIVMYGQECATAEIMISNADVALSFEKEVLTSPSPLPSAPVVHSEHAGSISDLSQQSHRSAHSLDSTDIALLTPRRLSFLQSVTSTTSATSATSGHHRRDSKVPEQSPGEDPSPRSVAGAQDKSYVFIRKLPRLTQASEVATFFETNFRPVERVSIELFRSVAEARFCCAHIQFTNESDGVNVIELSKIGGLVYDGIALGATFDATAPPDCTFQKLPRYLAYAKEHVTKHQPNEKEHSVNKSNRQYENLLSSFCRCLYNNQKARKRGEKGSGRLCHENNRWIPRKIMEKSFKPPVRCGDRDSFNGVCKEARDTAIAQGLVEAARLREEDQTFVTIALGEGCDGGLSRTFFLRLTAKGRKYIE